MVALAALAVIVLAADGPVFCAGHDLKELTAHRSDGDVGQIFFERTMLRCSEMMQAIVNCPKPVIAAVQGTATAAGCQLVATCDLAVAAEEEHDEPELKHRVFGKQTVEDVEMRETRKREAGEPLVKGPARRRARLEPLLMGRVRRRRASAHALCRSWPWTSTRKASQKSVSGRRTRSRTCR